MYIRIHVKTKAKREKIEKISDDHYDISVREPAKQNLANKRILEIFRNIYRRKLVRIVNGHHSPIKMISIQE